MAIALVLTTGCKCRASAPDAPVKASTPADARDADTPDGAEPSTRAPRHDTRALPLCGALDAAIEQLEAFEAADIPGTYWVAMTFTDTGWEPTKPIRSPMHHASRLELSYPFDVRPYGAHRGEHARVTLELTSRELAKLPDRNAWRGTYHARIASACLER